MTDFNALNSRSIVLVVIAVLASTACTSPVGPGFDGGGGDASSRPDATLDSSSDARGDTAPVRCGTSVCAAGQACCAATNLCYDPSCLSCCMSRADSGTGD